MVMHADKPVEDFVRFMHCEFFILCEITLSAQEVKLQIW